MNFFLWNKPRKGQVRWDEPIEWSALELKKKKNTLQLLGPERNKDTFEVTQQVQSKGRSRIQYVYLGSSPNHYLPLFSVFFSFLLSSLSYPTDKCFLQVEFHWARSPCWSEKVSLDLRSSVSSPWWTQPLLTSSSYALLHHNSKIDSLTQVKFRDPGLGCSQNSSTGHIINLTGKWGCSAQEPLNGP